MAIKGLPEFTRNKMGMYTCADDHYFAYGETRAIAFARWQEQKKNQQADLKRVEEQQKRAERVEEPVRASPF